MTYIDLLPKMTGPYRLGRISDVYDRKFEYGPKTDLFSVNHDKQMLAKKMMARLAKLTEHHHQTGQFSIMEQLEYSYLYRMFAKPVVKLKDVKPPHREGELIEDLAPIKLIRQQDGAEALAEMTHAFAGPTQHHLRLYVGPYEVASSIYDTAPDKRNKEIDVRTNHFELFEVQGIADALTSVFKMLLPGETTPEN